jgi:hypothetical protein
MRIVGDWQHVLLWMPARAIDVEAMPLFKGDDVNKLATKTACLALLLLLVMTGCGVEPSTGDGANEAPLFGTLWQLTKIEAVNMLFQDVEPAVEAVVGPDQHAPTLQFVGCIDDECLVEIKSDCGDCYGKVILEDDQLLSLEMACIDAECQSQGISTKYLAYLRLMNKRFRQGLTLQIYTAPGFEGYGHILHFSSRPSARSDN